MGTAVYTCRPFFSAARAIAACVHLGVNIATASKSLSQSSSKPAYVRVIEKAAAVILRRSSSNSTSPTS